MSLGLLGLGEVYGLRGLVLDAEHVVKRALQVDPSSVGALAQLAEIQRDLFSLGAELASPQRTAEPRINQNHVIRLEEWIDRWAPELPALKNFILPGGTPPAGFLHLARVICRRAERRVVSLARSADLSPEVIPYLNRLSDLLFVLARTENHQADVPDLIWTADEDV